MPSERDKVFGLWQEAQTSPSIIGRDVDAALGETIAVTIGGKRIAAIDCRLWSEGPDVDDALFLEVLLPGVPDGWDFDQVGKECVAAIEVYLKERRVVEFREKLVEHKEEQVLRQRRGKEAAADGTLEGGDEKEEKWKSFLHDKREPDALTLRNVVDIGGRGRPVIACRISMSVTAARDVGKLVYPNIFREKTSKEMEQEERAFLACYYTCICFLIVLVITWLTFLISGVIRTRGGRAPIPKSDL